MSDRKGARDSRENPDSTFSHPASPHGERVRDVCKRHGNRPDELLEILHEVQEALGHVSESVLPVIARALNLSRAEVHGVVTFYHDFRRAPAGRHVVKICRAESCQSMNGEALCNHARTSLKAGFGETTADGTVTLEAVYCLGNCALSPAMMVDGRLHGRVDARRFDEIMAQTLGEAAQ
ncbi:MAG: formate dehydrogenase subunit gamma [Parvibaculaceae bacterium]